MFATNDFARNFVGAAGAALLAGACLFAATTPAKATEAVSKTVTYADLNLAQPAGRATLETRIKAAARAVCATDSDDIRARAEKSRCIRTAIDAATRS